jgi:hypothetical protein
MMEATSAPLEKSERDGKSASELKNQKGVGSAAEETTEQGVPKRQGRADDPPQLVDETKEAVSQDIGAAPVGVTLGAFESEIERMSKDADAILDSIRNEAAESPNRIRRVVRDRREAINKSHDDDDDRREAINKSHDDDDDWDDDMSEELNRLGSVSEEIRQAEIDFMRGLVDLESDAEGRDNEPPLHGSVEERDNETLRQTPSPIKRNQHEPLQQPLQKQFHKPLQKPVQKPVQEPPQEPQQKEEQAQKLPEQGVQQSPQTTGQQQLQTPPTQTKGRADPALLVGVVLVYLVLMIHSLRVFRNGLLDAEGGLKPISLW